MDVERGSSLSQALAKHPKAFNRLYVSMVRAGEIGGVLDSVLMRLADTIEKQVELRRKVKSAMTYPAVVAILVLVIVTAMLLFIIPMFEGLYKELGGTLPLPTRLLIDISKVIRSFWWAIFGVEIAAVFAFRKWINSEDGRQRWDAIKLKMPIFGPVRPDAVRSRSFRCADPRVPRHRCGDLGQLGRCESGSRYASSGETRRSLVAQPRESSGVPADGRANDGRR